MGQYSIKELEKLSGIKAHTIRIWEKRYQLIEPARTETNIRLYSDSDLKKIINISLLKTNGYKISRIASMSDLEVSEEVSSLSESTDEFHFQIDRLITCMLDLDEVKFEAELNTLDQRHGFANTITRVIYPFLQKIGIMWQTASITPAHEHFISNLIRQRIIVAIANLPIPTKPTLRAMLFLPENEMHEIGLLFFHYVTKLLGIKTFYLGQAVPYPDLFQVGKSFRPHYIISTFTTFPHPKQLNEYLKQLCEDFGESRVLVAGSLVRNTSFTPSKNLTVFETAEELRHILGR